MVWSKIVHSSYVCILKMLSSHWGFQEYCIVRLVGTILIYPHCGDPLEGRGDVAILISPLLAGPGYCRAQRPFHQRSTRLVTNARGCNVNYFATLFHQTVHALSARSCKIRRYTNVVCCSLKIPPSKLSPVAGVPNPPPPLSNHPGTHSHTHTHTHTLTWGTLQDTPPSKLPKVFAHGWVSIFEKAAPLG